MGFPDGFWWGTTASSAQTEGSAPRSDLRRWEEAGRLPPSGDGNGFAHRFAEDLALYAEHGLTHHRLTLEWARLEPEQGRHDPAAVEHYRQVLTAGGDAGVSMWAGLHHGSLPGWFADDLGGFVDPTGRSLHWARHVDWVAETFGDLVHGWAPIDDPVAYASDGWLTGAMPPGRSDPGLFAEALEAVHLADHQAWRLLRSGDQPVMSTMGLAPLVPGVRDGDDPREGPAAAATCDVVDDVVWRSWIRAQRDGVLAVPGRAAIELDDLAGAFDVIGVSYVGARQVFHDGAVGPYPADAQRDDAGVAIWPEGLSLVLRRLADELPGRALCVAGCGLGTADDHLRARYLDECIGRVGEAVDDGIDVRGFFHRTGIDGDGWAHGSDVRSGLFDVDRQGGEAAATARRWATA